MKIQKLHAILERLPKREKIILYCAVFFVCLTIFDRLFISPVFSKIKSLNGQFAEKEKAIKKNLHILAQKDRILAERAKYASLLGLLESEEEEITSLLKEIENLASRNSVYLIDMKPADTKNMEETRKYLIMLNCEAQMEQITDFMYSIEDSSKLLRIEKYQISPKAKDSSIAKCSMSVSKVVVKE